MKTATSRPNRLVIILEDAQTEIRSIVKYAFLTGEARVITDRKIGKVIARATKGITIDRLLTSAKRSLTLFALAQIKGWQDIGLTGKTVAYLGAQASNGFPFKRLPTASDKAVLSQFKALNIPELNTGVPLSTYYQDVWTKQVKPKLDALQKGVALDPNDFTGRNSLRNFAEMEVRYEDHQKNIADLRASGTRLVISSTHADCSDRCAPHQGKVYSLDRTYGTTEDGRKFEPLENATEIYYTTKAGVTYKNGLLGFNCRHKLYEYKVGMQVPKVTAQQRREEYAITMRQRELERQVRKKKIEALMLKDINYTGYRKAKAEAKVLYEKYQDFSKANNRAYYPMRVAI